MLLLSRKIRKLSFVLCLSIFRSFLGLLVALYSIVLRLLTKICNQLLSKLRKILYAFCFRLALRL
ncbi:hypothetical protein IL38_07020 [Actinopolyspora erythraea]|uniref:Uncharacterized protein n=1 Tax=Actinopolyspora erythraea TaxID=414996 RepID=A0ABR4X693_9ACTN|nr:hypothetical protein IL38_07020 [Actinopolyspora erythraea]